MEVRTFPNPVTSPVQETQETEIHATDVVYDWCGQPPKSMPQLQKGLGKKFSGFYLGVIENSQTEEGRSKMLNRQKKCWMSPIGHPLAVQHLITLLFFNLISNSDSPAYNKCMAFFKKNFRIYKICADLLLFHRNPALMYWTCGCTAALAIYHILCQRESQLCRFLSHGFSALSLPFYTWLGLQTMSTWKWYQ